MTDCNEAKKYKCNEANKYECNEANKYECNTGRIAYIFSARHRELMIKLIAFVSTFLLCVFSNISSTCLPERRHIHTACICFAFFHCVSSNVSLNY